MWNYTDLIVSGMYLGEFPVTGKVRFSRVKYGGGVCHTIDLETPITIYGAVRDTVILDMEDVTQVQSN